MSCAAMIWSGVKEWDVSNGAKATGFKEISHVYYSISHAHFREYDQESLWVVQWLCIVLYSLWDFMSLE